MSKSLQVSNTLAQLLVQRGIETVEDARYFLGNRLKDLSDPFLFEGMDRAVARIFQALNKNEKVMVHGDYDVDGITGTALLCDILKKIGINAQPYIPDRVSEGYGMSREAIQKAVVEKIPLMITVDCGGTAFAEIEEADRQGIDVIVVDHHELKNELPPSIAVIHPRRMTQKNHFHPLAAVGVAFKLAHGLVKRGLEQKADWANKIDLKDFLDRVALGTVADLVPLKGENRIFVKQGLERLLKTECLGLSMLLKEIGLEGRSITTSDVGFKIAPRLNAAGRVGTAYDAVHLLLVKEKEKASTLAQTLDLSNRKRQELEQATYEEAADLLQAQTNGGEDWVLVLHKEEWPLGVIGIVASRILRLMHRPVFIISTEEGVSKGSARSIRGYHLCEALKSCEGLLEGYGGHAYAAGIKILRKKIPEFRERINQHAHQVLSSDDLIPSLEIDLEIPLESVSLSFAQEVEKLGPFGQENSSPLFLTKELQLEREPYKVGKNHLKLHLKNKNNERVEGIAFGQADLISQFSLSCPFQAVYEVAINSYQRNMKPQLIFKDFKF
ncbi:MAG: single-stranded-DNA-specific exonuclease RecJ [Chlamydiae bacterium]|nr:single-stranded-DNA-specific exonuclease RecJ [Chlamydiota bacterium]